MSRSRPIRPGDGDPRHGTVNGYSNLKCRCQRCRNAWAADHWAVGARYNVRIGHAPSRATLARYRTITGRDPLEDAE